jgi:hypothetical protein
MTAMRRSFVADEFAAQDLLAQLVALDGERT